jgi:hypothetical protein
MRCMSRPVMVPEPISAASGTCFFMVFGGSASRETGTGVGAGPRTSMAPGGRVMAAS